MSISKKIKSFTTAAIFAAVMLAGCSEDEPENKKGVFTDSRDGQQYAWVEIGSQVWMAGNLNYAGAESNLGTCYDGEPGNCATYGRLYNWLTVMSGTSGSSANPSGVRGICPEGWHVPSDAEWAALSDFAVENVAGRKLKATSGWNGGNGTDDFGFSALPGGRRQTGEDYWGIGEHGEWWSATEQGTESAWFWEMSSNRGQVYRFTEFRDRGEKSLRCVRD
ncbi:MAG: fibrobacter succinogenes major paralogous domain-containing protein [Chitinispirillales bacterium]|jgi:uncharacterized protein (TIGR02145 family)|nr:fibrobacter succinogenes major paralogous domain-containing protein [Chitinispirillales bacterium]